MYRVTVSESSTDACSPNAFSSFLDSYTTSTSDYGSDFWDVGSNDGNEAKEVSLGNSIYGGVLCCLDFYELEGSYFGSTSGDLSQWSVQQNVGSKADKQFNTLMSHRIVGISLREGSNYFEHVTIYYLDNTATFGYSTITFGYF